MFHLISMFFIPFFIIINISFKLLQLCTYNCFTFTNFYPKLFINKFVVSVICKVQYGFILFKNFWFRFVFIYLFFSWFLVLKKYEGYHCICVLILLWFFIFLIILGSVLTCRLLLLVLFVCEILNTSIYKYVKKGQ